GFAILLVIGNHAIHMANIARQEAGLAAVDPFSQQILIILSALGFMAVPIFLFLSGSFFAYAAQGRTSRLLLAIVRKNLITIIWPYLIWSVVFYFLLYFGHGQLFSPIEYVKHILVGYPFNFIPLIIFYIAISPLLLWLSNRIGWLTVLALIAAYQVLLIFVVFPASHSISLPGWTAWLAPPVLVVPLADWGIYFPLGMLFALNMNKMSPWLERFRWILVGIAIVFYSATVLHGIGLLEAPLLRHVFPFAVVLLLPLIPRQAIPQVKLFENIGKNAYGLYLTHLIVMDIFLLITTGVWPQALQFTLILVPILFFVGLYMPQLVMLLLIKSPARRSYQYLFG
ncbi:MAG: acyltransferase family protein, partial [Anaerolineales bacterium]